MNRTSRWLPIVLTLSLLSRVAADESLKQIPRVDVHAHCGTVARMGEYMEIRAMLEQDHGERLVAWIDLDLLRPGSDLSMQEYLRAANEKYAGRFLPCVNDPIRDGLQATAGDIDRWQSKGVVGLKIWVGLSDAIDDRAYDPLFEEMASKKFPGASIHIAQPYPTSWCDDPVKFWNAQNAWERVLDRHPELIAVNAHMLDHFNSDEQLDYLSYILTTYPNVHVDLAARFQQFHMMERDKLREFVIRFQDRILFGTDISKVMGSAEGMADRYHRCFQLLETDQLVTGAFFDTKQQRRGLDLPRPVLEKLYYRNAVRIYPRLRRVKELRDDE